MCGGGWQGCGLCPQAHKGGREGVVGERISGAWVCVRAHEMCLRARMHMEFACVRACVRMECPCVRAHEMCVRACTWNRRCRQSQLGGFGMQGPRMLPQPFAAFCSGHMESKASRVPAVSGSFIPPPAPRRKGRGPPDSDTARPGAPPALSSDKRAYLSSDKRA